MFINPLFPCLYFENTRDEIDASHSFDVWDMFQYPHANPQFLVYYMPNSFFTHVSLSGKGRKEGSDTYPHHLRLHMLRFPMVHVYSPSHTPSVIFYPSYWLYVLSFALSGLSWSIFPPKSHYRLSPSSLEHCPVEYLLQ